VTIAFGPRGVSLLLLFVLPFLLLAGCGSTEGIEVTDALIAGDGLLDKGKRVFFPATYWRDKAIGFSQRAVEERELYRKATQAYHEALKSRRQEIEQAVSQASKGGQDVPQARRKVIQQFRDKLDPLRQLSKKHGRAMSQAMELMQKSRKNLELTLTR